MTTLAVQYLEHAPLDATPAKVRRRLHQAFGFLPISIVILGWDLPPRLEEAVAEETAFHKAMLYRWHPLLVSEAGFLLPNEWQTINAHGEHVPAFKGLTEFTFICPNRIDVQEWIAERIEVAAQRGIYQGLFFDRVRYPSPAENPEGYLACFCKYCRRIASDSGLDIESVRRRIGSLRIDADRLKTFVQTLFTSTEDSLLESFFTFRSNSITRLIQYAAILTRSHGLSIGLDCFSPTFTRMVGQDLFALNKTCDWIKLMIYPRVTSPAGIPFELLGLADWLIKHCGVCEAEVMGCLREASGLPIPDTRAGLAKARLNSETMAIEIQRGHKMGITRLLAGIALVEMAGVNESTSEQIQADLQAARLAEGLVISWDLWQTPLERLDIIRSLWEV